MVFSREALQVIDFRPKVMLLAADGSITRGRGQRYSRPQVDDL